MINDYSLSRCGFVRYMSARLKQDRGRERCPRALVGLSLIQRGRFISTATSTVSPWPGVLCLTGFKWTALSTLLSDSLNKNFLWISTRFFILGQTPCTFRVTATPTRPAASLSSPYNCCSVHRWEGRTPGLLWSDTKNLYALAAAVHRKARKSVGAESKW